MILVANLLVSVLLFTVSRAQEQCFDICSEKYSKSEQEQAACKEGCRLQVIFEFANGQAAVTKRDDCFNGCIKSYENQSESEACKFGCASQPSMKKNRNVHVTFTNKEPGFELALAALRKMFSNPFSSFSDSTDPSSEEQLIETNWRSPFADFHRRMLEQVEQFHQIANNIMNIHRGNAMNHMISMHRPTGHMQKALEGPAVGNRDSVGQVIIDAEPVKLEKSQQLLGIQGENPTVVEIQETSLLSRLATRARRLSVLSRWLVCAALFLCLISMLSISVAIIKQIKSQRYQNLRNAHLIMAPPFMESHEAKKVPLDEPLKINDYPVVHDTPPPAYDQLSIHKNGDQDENATPKI